MDKNQGLTRRGVLGCAGLTLLSACAPASLPAPVTPSAPSAPTTGATASPIAAPTPTPTPGPTTPPGPALPTRDQIIATYGGRTPTQWALEVTGLVLRTAGPAVALTLDACGGPTPGTGGNGVDSELVDFLIAEEFPATLFLNQRWIRNNRGVFDSLAARQDLFTLGNHGTRHAPLSVNGKTAYSEKGTADVGEVYDEVVGNQLYMTDLLGAAPRFFRTGTAFYDEVAVEIVRALGLLPIGFDINGDAGTTFPKKTIIAETEKSKPGSIIISHMNRPAGSTFEGLSVALPAMRARGLTFAKLGDLTLS